MIRLDYQGRFAICAMPDHYPPVGFHFRVSFTLGGVTDNDFRFAEVSGISASLGVQEVVEGGENRFTHRLPDRAKYANLILKRGLVSDSGLISWIRDALENFTFKPTEVLVSLLNEKSEPLKSWNFIGAYPVKWSASDFKATDNAVVIETLELAYQYFTPE